jgi:hypothetical protein
MGKTGIEVFEIVNGLVDVVKPKAVIVIDSLASRSIERISKSIQISDTGIVPRKWSWKCKTWNKRGKLESASYCNRSSNSCRNCSDCK